MTHRPPRRSSSPRRGVVRLAAQLTVLLVLAASLIGCAGTRPTSIVPPTPPTPPVSGSASTSVTPTTPGTPAAPAPRDPQLVAWGRDGRLLSMVVRNVDDRQVRQGLVRISLYDGSGRLLLATTGPPASKCCTILSLPPRHRFGLFLALPDGIGRISRVAVAFASPDQVQLHAWPRGTAPRIDVGVPTYQRTATDARVTVTLRPRRTGPPYVAGQAFLVDRRGRLVAVISGRFYCFADHLARRVTMGLQHPVPPGTRLGDVVAYPLPRSVRPHVPYTCRTSSETP